MRWLRRIAKTLGYAIGALLLLLGIWALVPASTPRIEGEHAIAALERVTLGGAEQTILLRGQDRRNPALLFVHGGPGFGQLPLARTYSDQLEAHFVVVHWDQRGAGASCPGTDFAALTREQIVADALELSEALAARFGGGGKVFLLGHSWGSVVGALAVQQRPELFHAYVGLGQLVNGPRNEELSYRFVREEAERRGDAEALAELSRIRPPYPTLEELGTQRRWLNAYRGSIHDMERAQRALPAALFGREYTLATRLRFFPCFERSLGPLWGSLDGFDAVTQIPRLDVPVYFFTGRHDWNTPFPLVEEWAATLEAPQVEIVWFDGAGHFPSVEAPEEFQQRLLEKLTPLAPAR
jgi:pimeloyl-ACP methyl ester carboxylesterase